MVAAARLLDRVTIRRLQDVPDGKGGFDRGWVTIGQDLPAEVISQGGREAMLGSTMEGISAFRITIRKRDDVRPADQLIWNGREMNIRNAEPDFREPRSALVIFADTSAPLGAA